MTSLLITQTTITVKRYTVDGSQYDEQGRVKEPTEATLTMNANVFPVTEEEIEFLPEGTDLNSTFKVRTAQPLIKNETEKFSDIVIIAGKQYQVIRSGDWTSHQSPVIIPKFYRSYVTLV
jgi:hypothetical protein